MADCLTILAHRGLWRTPAEKNSPTALKLAWHYGFGVETDVRDQDGRLVVSHDPPVGKVWSFDRFLEAYSESGGNTVLALNVKADGLQAMLADALATHGINPRHYFVFDMSVPDALGYLRRNLPCFTRHSEIEPHPAFLDQASGVWIDCFSHDWIDGGVVERHLQSGHQVALVSPELHGRPWETAWKVWKILVDGLNPPHRAMLMLCTDFPEAARNYFNG